MPGPVESKDSDQLAQVDDPRRWLGSTALLDLEDPKLRVKARALTQLCKSEREKALAIYGFVKRIPFAKPFKLRQRLPREVIAAGRGDAADKITVLIAMLRAAGLPARVRYLEVSGEILRGITTDLPGITRPVAEVWLQGRWLATDTYIFDALFVAAARERLKAEGLRWGYGIHLAGHSIWNGAEDAFLAGLPPEQDPLVLNDFGRFDDPAQFTASPAYKASQPRLARALNWNLQTPSLERRVRSVREEAAVGPQLGFKRTS